MLTEAFEFMNDTKRPHLHGDARSKILLLVQEIESIYKAEMRRSTGHLCDICGRGDTNDRCKVSDCIPGYEHREHVSPRLCYNHACGWRSSFGRLLLKRKSLAIGLDYAKCRTSEEKLRTFIEVSKTHFSEPVIPDEEVDLHFSLFLANQLRKAAQQKE